ncbi:MAG: hypothetical protein KGL39_03175 [Patescibacteria group bacterium]|nr:hypothetical protein [Patescibacteria group bacterium]
MAPGPSVLERPDPVLAHTLRSDVASASMEHLASALKRSPAAKTRRGFWRERGAQILSFSETKRIANYHYDTELVRRRCGDRTYILGFACAYNAFGLIGPEKNGVFILDETKKAVVLDEHMRIDTGYFGRKPDHTAEIARLYALPDAAFLTFIKEHPRARGAYR